MSSIGQAVRSESDPNWDEPTLRSNRASNALEQPSGETVRLNGEVDG